MQSNDVCINPRNPLLLSARELARELSISPATLWRWHSAGRLPAPALRQGQVVHWSRQTVVEWIAAGCPDRRTWETIKAADAAQRNGRPQ
jgi:predicted DNA-binding transcriptional regulator AlpA